MQHPTLHDVARAAGVSPATVSRVLNENPQVAPEMCARVRAVVARLGYRRSALVSSVMRELRRTAGRVHRGNLAFLTQDLRTQWETGAGHFYPPLFAGVCARAESQGYGVEVFEAQTERAAAAVARTIEARGILGVIRAPAINVSRPFAFPWERFSSVYLGSQPITPQLHYAASDYYRNILTAMHRLAVLGYRRPGLCTTSDQDHRHAHLGLAAWHVATVRGSGLDRVPVLIADQKPATVIAWVRKCRPDVVVSATASPLTWLRKAGWRIPEDLGFFCINGPIPEEPSAAHFRIPYCEIATAAVDLLTRLVEHREAGVPVQPRATLVTSQWCDGPTLRRRECKTEENTVVEERKGMPAV